MRQLPLGLALFALGTVPAASAAELGSWGATDLHLDGLVQYDGYRFDKDVADLDGDPDGDSVHDLRRVELVLKGNLPGNLDWVVAYDAKSEVFLDAAVRLRFGSDSRHSLQLGQFKQPNGLEELGSTRGNDFIAKATATSTYAISRRLGLAYRVAADDWAVAASVFGRELTRGQDMGPGFGARATWVPLRTASGLLHLGLSHVDYDTDADALRLRARPNADLAGARLVDSGLLTDTDRIATTGLEGMWLAGSWKLQGEFFQARVHRHGQHGDYRSSGGYLSAVWNLGDAEWGYRAGLPVVAPPGEAGLWQLGLRLDTLDLDDGIVAGGRQDAATAGVNWYPGSHLKLALNHVRIESHRLGVEDDPGIWEARVQLHW